MIYETLQMIKQGLSWTHVSMRSYLRFSNVQEPQDLTNLRYAQPVLSTESIGGKPQAEVVKMCTDARTSSKDDTRLAATRRHSCM